MASPPPEVPLKFSGFFCSFLPSLCSAPWVGGWEKVVVSSGFATWGRHEHMALRQSGVCESPFAVGSQVLRGSKSSQAARGQQ